MEDGTYGYVPAMLNGERVELLLRFDAETGEGELIGIRTVYEDEEIQELPKTQTELGGEIDLENTTDADSETRVRLLQPGDVLDFLCDYYRYDGSYENSYFLGEQLVIGQDGVKIENVPLEESDRPVYTFRFTDLYQQHYWTESLRG